MDITLLIQSFIFLIIVLAVLMFFLLASRKAKKLKEQEASKSVPTKQLTLSDLREKLKNKKLSSEQLQETLNLVLENYGEIKKFEDYIEIILRMVHHPHVNKDIIIRFEKELSKLNPEFASSIGKNITLGLNSRHS
jgi:hypothetical protein